MAPAPFPFVLAGCRNLLLPSQNTLFIFVAGQRTKAYYNIFKRKTFFKVFTDTFLFEQDGIS